MMESLAQAGFLFSHGIQVVRRKEHWETVYATKPPDRVGWFRPRLETSLDWIAALPLDVDAAIIDIGGGASTLVDNLLDAGYRDVTVLDIAAGALELSQARLGEAAEQVEWIVADVTSAALPSRRFELWHDRAVFHFLTDDDDRNSYIERAAGALKPGSHLLVGTFAPEAPPTCSGLPVERYDRDTLAGTFGNAFELLRHHKELHVTPGGVEQMYLYALFRMA
jgi:SAM-dependent methyltransferase